MEDPILESQPHEVDLSDEFLSLSVNEFSERVRELRKVPRLRITADFSKIDEPSKFVWPARRLKAFLEDARGSQERQVIVRGRKEQRSWEANVFSSGVKFEQID
jgi:hypothetical protein